MSVVRRKRLPDGSLGELEKVFGGETDEEKIKRLENELNKTKMQNKVLIDELEMTNDVIQEIILAQFD